jgi:leucyl-tRNA synthetase
LGETAAGVIAVALKQQGKSSTYGALINDEVEQLEHIALAGENVKLSIAGKTVHKVIAVPAPLGKHRY